MNPAFTAQQLRAFLPLFQSTASRVRISPTVYLGARFTISIGVDDPEMEGPHPSR